MPSRRFRKPYRVKRKKSIFRNRFFWLALLLILSSGGLIYFLFFSAYFQLREIRISGNQKVIGPDIENIIKEEYSRKIFPALPVKSILLLNSRKVENIALENYPQINTISVKKELPDKIWVEVHERSSFGVWCKNDAPCFYFDQEGIIFEEVPEGTLHNIIIKDGTEKEDIKLGERIIERNIAEFCLKAKNELRDYFEIEIPEYDILSAEKLDAETNQGWKIFFNPKEDLDLQLTKLTAILESEIPVEERGNLEYIDLRFSRVYYLNKTTVPEEEKQESN